MKSDNWRPGPDVTRAHHFEAAFCDNPECGLHIVAFTEDHKPICEIVTSRRQTLILVEICQDHLYDKAVRRDHD
jgi:hypothetical protein